MRLTCVTIVATLFVLHHIAASDKDGQSCKTPRGRLGICRNLRTCTFLMFFVQHYGIQAGDFLRGTVCDNDGPLVCCPAFVDDKRKDNGGHDADNDKNDTGKKVNWTYKPLVAPACGSNADRYIPNVTALNPELEKTSSPQSAWLGYSNNEPPYSIIWEQCVGNLISSRHILTAAYCAYNRPNLRLARLGPGKPESDAVGTNPIDVLIEKATVHPLYNSRTRVNDIAVLRLQGEIEFTAIIHPICLPLNDVFVEGHYIDDLLDLQAHAAAELRPLEADDLDLEEGFGALSTAEKWCKLNFKNFDNVTIDQRIVCYSPNDIDRYACSKPIGTSLEIILENNAYIIGVLSYRRECDEPDKRYPLVLTRVTSFLDFIESQLN